MQPSFLTTDFHALCDLLASSDYDLLHVIETYGYPPFWSRPNTFETLVHIILEQQVSLASAKAALEQLRSKIGDITPKNVLLLSDADMKAAYFSRQKMGYVRAMSHELIQETLNLKELEQLSDETVRNRLLQLKGIGNWTVDIYLIMVLHRSDIFPIGDLAAVNALKQLKHLHKTTPRGNLLVFTEQWKPYRTIATMLLWHFYISERN